MTNSCISSYIWFSKGTVLNNRLGNGRLKESLTRPSIIFLSSTVLGKILGTLLRRRIVKKLGKTALEISPLLTSIT